MENLFYFNDLILQISPNHCTCDNTSGCVTTVDLTEKLNLSYLMNNCSLASYVTQHIFNDHNEVFRSYRRTVTNCWEQYPEFRSTGCSSWVEDYIQSDSRAFHLANAICNSLRNQSSISNGTLTAQSITFRLLKLWYQNYLLYYCYHSILAYLIAIYNNDHDFKFQL